MSAQPEPLWSTADVATLCGVAQSTVRYWRHIGTGPPGAKIGRHVRYRPAEVQAWVDQHWTAAAGRQRDPAGR